MSKHYDPIMCMMVEDKAKVKDGIDHVNERKVTVNGEVFTVWSDQIARRTIARNSEGQEKPISGSGYISNENTVKKAIKQVFMNSLNSRDKRTVDVSAVEEFKKTKALCQQIISQYSGTQLGRKIDANSVLNHTESIINKMDFYISNATKGWYD